MVFSQFTTFLNVIQTALTRESLSYARFDGTMDLKKRQAAIKTFKDPDGPDGRPRPMVLLISLKAGGVGLNLTNANYAFMVSGSCTFRGRVGIHVWSDDDVSQMDCWWNAAVENQGSSFGLRPLPVLTRSLL